MTLNTIMKCIFVGLLIAIPFPFVADWFNSFASIEHHPSIYLATALATTIGCLILSVGSAASAEKPIKDNSTPAGNDSVQVSTSTAEGREEGVVKWFNISKGFGFITRASGEDVFVHYRSILGGGRRTLSDGQKVEFIVVAGEKGLQAEEVSVIA